MIRLKKIMLMFICVTLIMSCISIPAYAIDDNGNGGGGGGTGSGNSAYTWDDNQSGYRISIVDKDFKQVSTTVDFLFSKPSSNGRGWGNDFYTNSRANGLSTDTSSYDAVQIQDLKDRQITQTSHM